MTSDMPNIDELARAIETASKHESVVTQIFTLGIEYESKTITAQRFADRVIEILATQYKVAKKDSPQPQSSPSISTKEK